MGKGESKLSGGAVAGGTKAGEGVPNDATEYYVSGEGMWINQYLRGRGEFGELTDSEKEYLKDLDKATNGKIKEKTLYRSVDATAIFGSMDDFEYSDMRNVVVHGDDVFGKGEYAQNKAKVARNRVDNVIGKTITEKGFMSTTSEESVASNFGGFTGSTRPIVLKIKTSESTRGVDLSVYDKGLAPEDAQHERLLARGQSFKVKKVYSKNGSIYVDVEMK